MGTVVCQSRSHLHGASKTLPSAERTRGRVELPPVSPFGACTGSSRAIWKFSSEAIVLSYYSQGLSAEPSPGVSYAALTLK